MSGVQAVIFIESSNGGTWELRLWCLRIYGLGLSHLGLKLSLGLLSLGDSSGLLVGRIRHMDIDQFPHRNGGSLTVGIVNFWRVQACPCWSSSQGDGQGCFMPCRDMS